MGGPVCAVVTLASFPVEFATRKRGASVGGSGVDNVVAGCGRWRMNRWYYGGGYKYIYGMRCLKKRKTS